MRTKLLAAALAAAVLLGGCAGWDYSGAEQKCDTAFADPALDPLRAKIVIGRSDAILNTPLAMLRDTDRPTERERAALAAYADAFTRCDAAFAAVEPPLRLLVSEPRPTKSGFRNVLDAARTSAIADLMDGRLTWGEFNRKRVDMLAQLAAEIERANVAIDAGRAARPIIIPQPVPAYVPAPVTCHTVGRLTQCF
jgi:hypothetical protein